jgi:hypothetical protein
LDLPEVRPHVTEFVVDYGYCEECGRRAGRDRRPATGHDGELASESALALAAYSADEPAEDGQGVH